MKIGTLVRFTCPLGVLPVDLVPTLAKQSATTLNRMVRDRTTRN
jgi:hypothetical protein